MSQKRRAAADIFQEQNIQQQQPDDQEKADVSVARELSISTGASVGKFAGTRQLDAPAAAPSPPAQPRAKRAPSPPPPPPGGGLKTSEELQLEKEPIKVRETGFWRWKRVIVPPNAYVVHTRMGHEEPVTLGLGVSFRYNPFTDAYLVVPAAMQTIGVVANCISREKQGLNILAYVQWQISDFSIAYRKLDFSDSRDPLGIVNAQLREQAEAAIKDKIATMTVEEVLADKEPIIEELTNRLTAVSEGRNQKNEQSDEGLGINIVTVQLKEAYVSSQKLWNHLQAPFRYEQEKLAQMSYLDAQEEIRAKQLETRRISETSEAETMVEIERIKQGKETEAQELRLTEEARRFTRSQESAREKIQLEEQTTITRRESEQRLAVQAAQTEQEQLLAELRRQQEQEIEETRLNAEARARQKALEVEQTLKEIDEETRLAEARLQTEQADLERQTKLKELQAEYSLLLQRQQDELQKLIQENNLSREQQENVIHLEIEAAQHRLKIEQAEKEASIARLQQEIRNLANQRDLASRLIERLPELAAQMPDIHELKVLQTGNDSFDALSSFLARIQAMAQQMNISLTSAKPEIPDEKNTAE